MPRKLSLEEKAAQLLVVGFDGKAVGDHLAEVLDLGAGGVIYFRRNLGTPEEILALSRDIFSRSSLSPPIIAVDQEAGLVTRLSPPFAQWPGNAAIGKSKDLRLAEAVARVIGRELKNAGINTDFAPVVDVHSNPRNPIIGPRSFGSDPAFVSKMGTAFIKGLQGAGVAACAKHFPGHGDTNLDSHIALPVVKREKKSLAKIELPPFRAAARAKVASMMTAHVLYAALDPERPATLSPKIITGILRNQMKYQGVVFTDDLSMMGVAKGRSHEEIAAQSIAAGCDVLLACQDFQNQKRFLNGVVEAVRSGILSEKRLDESLRRIAKFKAKFAKKPPEAFSSKWIGSAAHRKVQQQAAKWA